MLKDYAIDCKNCTGLCCTALYFSKTDGFPEDKVAGKPCSHLKSDYTCDCHDQLEAKGLKGCIGYDCFGAGQFITQRVFPETSWKASSSVAIQVFDAFAKAFSLAQTAYYLESALEEKVLSTEHAEIMTLLEERNRLLEQMIQGDFQVDSEDYRSRANAVLKRACKKLSEVYCKKPQKQQQWFGRAFKNQDFTGQDLCMTLLIGADFTGSRFTKTLFLGADTRDARFDDADLSEAVFLTQGQINVAKGNLKTKLPGHLMRPKHWG